MQTQHIKHWLLRYKLLALAATVVALASIVTLLVAIRDPEEPIPESSSTSEATAVTIDSNQPLVVGELYNTTPVEDKPVNPRTDIPYDELFRHSDNYKGQFVRYKGKVIQVLGEPGSWNLRINITAEAIGSHTYWDDTVFVYSYSQERVLDDDIIEFTAKVNGTITYKSVLGGDITIPSLTMYEQGVVGRAE